jgi:hypothetical protein
MADSGLRSQSQSVVMPQFGLDMFSSIVDSGQYSSAKRARGNTALKCGPFAERYMRFDPQAVLVVTQEIADGEIGACFAGLGGHVVCFEIPRDVQLKIFVFGAPRKLFK